MPDTIQDTTSKTNKANNIISFSTQEGQDNKEFKDQVEDFNKLLVDSLEEWLKDAKNGDLKGLAIVGVTTDGTKMQRAYRDCYSELLSGMTILQTRLSVFDSQEGS